MVAARTNAGFPRNPTEACTSIGSESRGYRKNEDYATDLYLIRSIDAFRARGSNYLLNIEPETTGLIRGQAAAIQDRTGAWIIRKQHRCQRTICYIYQVNGNILCQPPTTINTNQAWQSQR